jgi:hypothetical protein
MSREPHPLLKPSVERLFDALQPDLHRLDRHFGAPALLVLDNSPEFFSNAFLEAVIANAIGAHYAIPPGSENPEST